MSANAKPATRRLIAAVIQNVAGRPKDTVLRGEYDPGDLSDETLDELGHGLLGAHDAFARFIERRQ